jgi:hypothetical protein
LLLSKETIRERAAIRDHSLAASHIGYTCGECKKFDQDKLECKRTSTQKKRDAPACRFISRPDRKEVKRIWVVSASKIYAEKDGNHSKKVLRKFCQELKIMAKKSGYQINLPGIESKTANTKFAGKFFLLSANIKLPTLRDDPAFGEKLIGLMEKWQGRITVEITEEEKVKITKTRPL